MTGSKTIFPTLLAVCVVVAAAGILMAGPIAGREEPRWVRLTVQWSPSPRAEPIIITWMINGVGGPKVPAVTHSPWPSRDIPLHRGETLVLHAMQKTVGQLTCAIFERGKVIADSTVNKAEDIAECVVIGT